VVTLSLVQLLAPMMPPIGGYRLDLSVKGFETFLGGLSASTSPPRVSSPADPSPSLPNGNAEAKSAAPVPQLRPLGIRVNTEPGGDGDWFHRANSVIRSPRAYASNGTLVLEFDARKVEGPDVHT